MSEEPTAPTNGDGSRDRAAAILAEMEAALVEIQAVAAHAKETREEITREQSAIADKSAEIQAALEHGEEVGRTLDSKLTSIELRGKDADESKARAQAAADQAVKLQAETQTTKGLAEAALDRVTKAASTGEESADLTKGLAAKSVAVEAKIAEYEGHLTELGATYDKLVEKIEGLLPGAASAGLATVYSKRAGEHKPLKNRWQWLFIGSLLALLGIAGLEVHWMSLLDEAPGYDELFRRFLNRLPLVTPIAILVWYSAMRAAQSRQLEEEYAFKAATAASFEGFAKMMKEIPEGHSGQRPLHELSSNVLRILAASPQRIFHRDQSKELPTAPIVAGMTGAPGVAVELAKGEAVGRAISKLGTKNGVWTVVSSALILVVLTAILVLLVAASIKGTLFAPNPPTQVQPQ